MLTLQPLAASVDDAEAASSPIMAALQAVAIERLTAKHDREVPTKVIVASDMMEHTQYFSNYRDGANFQKFGESPAAKRYATDLAGATVDLYLIPRLNSPVDNVSLVQFWATWVNENHGRFDSAVRLQGAE